MSTRQRIWNDWECRWKPQRRRSPAYRTRRALRRWLRASRIVDESPAPQPEAVARMARIEARAEWPFRMTPEECPAVRITESRKLDFRFCPRFHPGREGVVAASGWFCEAEATWQGFTERARVHLGLSREGAESVARDFARDAVISAFQAAPVGNPTP